MFCHGILAVSAFGIVCATRRLCRCHVRLVYYFGNTQSSVQFSRGLQTSDACVPRMMVSFEIAML